MRKERIKSLYKAPGKAPVLIEAENELHALQAVVGGNLEAFTLTTDCCVLCDEEGRLKELPYNCNIANVSFVGPILLVGVDGEEFCDLPVDIQTDWSWLGL